MKKRQDFGVTSRPIHDHDFEHNPFAMFALCKAKHRDETAQRALAEMTAFADLEHEAVVADLVTLAESLRGGNPGAYRDLAWFLYWDFRFSVVDIAAIMAWPEGTEDSIAEFAGPIFSSQFVCGECGIDVPIKDWTALESGDAPALCEACQAKREKANASGRPADYDEYLKSDHWQSVRKEARERAGGACQLCNARDVELHTHHRTYARLGAELPSDVTVLCKQCHQLVHDNRTITKVAR